MISIRSILLLGLPVLALCSTQDQREDDTPDLVGLKRIANALSEESLKAAFSDFLAPKYRDGVFQDRDKAIEAVHSNDPNLATKLVDTAIQEVEKQDLRKRQNSNSTSTTVETTTSSSVVSLPSTTSVSATTETTTSSTIVPSSTVAVPPTSTSQGPTTAPGTTAPGTTANAPTSNGGTTAAGTTAAGSPPASVASPSTQTGVLVPVQISSTNSAGSVVVQTTSAFQTSAPTSVVVPITTTNAQGQQITTSSIVPAAVVTSTNAQGSVVTSASPLASVRVAPGGSIITSAPPAGSSGGGGSNNGASISGPETTTDQFGNTVVLSGQHAGQVITTTDAHGRTVVMTFKPAGAAVSELVLQTTRLPNGQLSTFTSFAVVGGGGATSTQAVGGGGSSPSSSGSGKPGLQSGAAAPTGRYVGEVAALVGGAIGVAALL